MTRKGLNVQLHHSLALARAPNRRPVVNQPGPLGADGAHQQSLEIDDHIVGVISRGMTGKQQADLFYNECLEGAMSGYALSLRPLVDRAPGHCS